MNINFLEKFTINLKKYQILYSILIICIISYLGIVLIVTKNINKQEYEGIGLDDDIFIITNLKLEDLDFILKCKKMLLDDKQEEIIILEVLESNHYTLKLKGDNIRKNQELKVQFILKEEKLYEFIIRNVKGW